MLLEAAAAFEDTAAAPEASPEIHVSLWDTLSIELQELIVTFVRKHCAHERQALNQDQKHYVHLDNSWNQTRYRGPIKSETAKSLLRNKIKKCFYAYYQTMSGRTKRFYSGRKLAEVENSLERAKYLSDRYPLGVDFTCRKRIEF